MPSDVNVLPGVGEFLEIVNYLSPTAERNPCILYLHIGDEFGPCRKQSLIPLWLAAWERRTEIERRLSSH